MATAVVGMKLEEGKMASGVACFVKDYEKHSFIIRVFHLYSRSTLWEIDLLDLSSYLCPSAVSQCISDTEGTKATFSFMSETEASFFKASVEGVLKRRKLTKSDISYPSNFVHVQHATWDPNTGFGLDNVNVTEKNALKLEIPSSQKPVTRSPNKTSPAPVRTPPPPPTRSPGTTTSPRTPEGAGVPAQQSRRARLQPMQPKAANGGTASRIVTGLETGVSKHPLAGQQLAESKTRPSPSADGAIYGFEFELYTTCPPASAGRTPTASTETEDKASISAPCATSKRSARDTECHCTPGSAISLFK
ncbi:Neural Wiskott-Aldrich syndrome protein [Halotydeus destructor]|nr:Neural Wiskott-Aldrich syndrome protein [Halotydeus destructor]